MFDQDSDHALGRARAFRDGTRWPQRSVCDLARTPPGFLSLVGLLSWVLVGALACSSDLPKTGSQAPPRHLLLITVDTLRADHTSLFEYSRDTTPFLRRFAERGVLVEQAISQWPKTGPSFASMFTGLYPQTTRLMFRASCRIPASYEVLPELLRKQGFRTVAVVSNPVLSPELGWDRGFDEFEVTWPQELAGDPRLDRQSVNSVRVNELAMELLERNRDAPRLFVWIHYSDPHAPYLLPEGVADPFVGDPPYEAAPHDRIKPATRKGYRIGDWVELRRYIAAYDANVAVVDRAIEELLVRAEEIGLAQNAAIVMTADHGESLGENDLFFEHGPLPYNNTLHVPLVLVGRGLPVASRFSRPVELLDLMPTLWQWLLPGVTPPAGEGRSVLPYLMEPMAAELDKAEPWVAFSGAGRSRRVSFQTAQDQRWKLVTAQPQDALSDGRLDPKGVELYDLLHDPGETTNLRDREPGELRRLRSLLRAWLQRNVSEFARTLDPPEDEGEDMEDPLSEKEQQALRAMGYVN